MLGLSKPVSVAKYYNLEHHHKSGHKIKYDSMNGRERENTIKQLTKSVRQQQNAITKLGGTDDSIKTSYIIAPEIDEKMKSFSDGDITKDYILFAAQCISSQCVKNFNNISLS